MGNLIFEIVSPFVKEKIPLNKVVYKIHPKKKTLCQVFRCKVKPGCQGNYQNKGVHEAIAEESPIWVMPFLTKGFPKGKAPNLVWSNWQ